MHDPGILLAQAASPQSPLSGLVLPVVMFAVFYLIWFQPMRAKQKRLEQLQKDLKAGDKVIINPGIFGTVVGLEDDAVQVRVDDKTKIKVLKSAVAGLQGTPIDTEK